MTARIFIKLISAVLIVMLVAFAAIDLLSAHYAEQAYLNGLKTELSEKIRMFQTMERTRLLELTPASVHALARAAGGRLTIIAPDGHVLLDSDAIPARMENHAARPEVREALQGRIGIATRSSASVGVRFLYVAGPVNAGVARLAVPLSDIEHQVSGQLTLHREVPGLHIPGRIVLRDITHLGSQRAEPVR